LICIVDTAEKQTNDIRHDFLFRTELVRRFAHQWIGRSAPGVEIG
jgi:hypothetical protein